MDLSPAPYFSEIADGPDEAEAHWITCSDGLRIRVGHWIPSGLTNPKGTVLIFPGRTEYVEKYGPAAIDLAKRGYASLAIDWRGQGIADRMLEDRRLGHVDEFGDFQKDVAAVIDAANALGLPKPWYLLAHSMGGCIGLRALNEGLHVNAAAFSAPMWGIQIPPALRSLAKIIGALAPRLGFAHLRVPTTTVEHYVQATPFKGNTLTNDQDMYRFMQRQLEAEPDLVLGGPTLQWLSEGVKECSALAQTGSPVLPCITFLGTQEQIVNSPAIHDRMARWPGGELVMVENAQHEVVMEDKATRDRAFDRMCMLFDQYPG